jgi:CRP/FNR family cyclic AMP-dependent transcriptional regulator
MSGAGAGKVFDNLEQVGSGAAFAAQVCAMMERTDMFGDLEHHEIERIAPYISVYRAREGNRVMEEDDRESYMFILVKGRLQIIKRDEDNTNKKLAIVREGKSIGEMSVIDGMHHSATVVALQESELLLLTKHNFDMLVERNPEVGVILLRKIANLMSLRLRRTSGVLVDYLDE